MGACRDDVQNHVRGTVLLLFPQRRRRGRSEAGSKLDPNHKELANTIVLGKSGTGKTVLECFLLTQAQKFNKPPLKR